MLLISALARVLAKDNRICELRKRNRQLRILRSASTTRRINNYKDFPAERALDDRNNRRKHEENTNLVTAIISIRIFLNARRKYKTYQHLRRRRTPLIFTHLIA